MKYIQQIEPWLGKEEEREVLQVLKSGWITEAFKTKEFEEKIAKFLNISYALTVPNGTLALYIALAALGIGKGDEVIVPDFTMVASPNAVVLAGATPVFVDIQKDNLCLDISQLGKKVTKKTRAIMPVYMNGRYLDEEALIAFCKKRNLAIVEDAAQALGCYYKNKHLGTFGDIGCFSFSTPKVITTGQGGVVVTKSKKLFEKMARLKDFGRINRNSEDHDEIGYNFKFTDFQAAVGIAQMKKLPWRLKRKKQMYKLYNEKLRDISQITFLETDLSQTSPWFIDIFVEDPAALSIHLKKNGIGTRLFYRAVHTTKPYKGKENFPNSLWTSKHGLWLPSSSFLKDSDIIRICNCIRAFYEKK